MIDFQLDLPRIFELTGSCPTMHHGSGHCGFSYPQLSTVSYQENAAQNTGVTRAQSYQARMNEIVSRVLVCMFLTGVPEWHHLWPQLGHLSLEEHCHIDTYLSISETRGRDTT